MQLKLATTMGLAALLALCFAGQANAACCTYLNKCYHLAQHGPCNPPMTGSGCCKHNPTSGPPRMRNYDMGTLVADIEAGAI